MVKYMFFIPIIRISFYPNTHSTAVSCHPMNTNSHSKKYSGMVLSKPIDLLKKHNKMSNNMTLGGIGPKMALISLPYISLCFVLLSQNPAFLEIGILKNSVAYWSGISLLSIGFIFYLNTIIVFLKDFKQGKLITRGPFSLCRNPLYTSIILLILPGFGILFHSGIILSIPVVLYLNFKISIHGESIILKRTFGSQYDEYCSRVREFLPVPRRIRNKQ